MADHNFSQKILLVDGHGLLFRGFYATFYSNTLLTSPDGQVVNGLYSFVRMLNTLVQQGQYYDIIVAFDKGRKTWRHKQFADYKAHRKPTPIELIQQIPLVKEFLHAANIKLIDNPDYEADDLIASLAKTANQQGFVVDILSSDKDLMQLINPHTRMLLPARGVSNLNIMDKAAFILKYNFEPKYMVDYKAIAGDPSDNIKGVKGIGEKGAQALIAEYETVENILNNLSSLKPRLHNLINNGKSDMALFKQLTQLCVDVDVEQVLPFTELSMHDNQTKNFFQKYGFKSLLKEAPSVVVPSAQIISKWTPQFNDNVSYIYLELDNYNYFRAKPIGVIVSNQKGCYMLDWNLAIQDEAFIHFLSSAASKKIVFNAKALINFARRDNVAIAGISDDVMVMGYLVDSSLGDDITEHINYFCQAQLMSHKDFYGNKRWAKQLISQDELLQYLSSKVHYLAQLFAKLSALMQAQQVKELYDTAELPCSFVLADMEWSGIQINTQLLQTLLHKTGSQLQAVESAINQVLPQSININSTQQLQSALYNDLQIPPLDNKRSTDKWTLSNLLDAHPVISLILQQRELKTLYTRYLKGLQKNLFQNNLVHTIFKNASTATGRLSSVDPNMQNLAVKSDNLNFIGKLFVPCLPDNVFVSFDYSQIELRILAHLSGEPKLIEAFHNGTDVHVLTAAELFNHGSDLTKVTNHERQIAKTVNFFLLYGEKPFRLQQIANVTYDTAKKLINNYKQTYPEVAKLKTKLIAQAEKHGYATTAYKRRRNLENLHSNSRLVRNQAAKMAVNMPIQGLAADIIKIAMVRIDQELKAYSLKSHLVLQIHDELVLEVFPSELQSVQTLVENCMTQSTHLKVPLPVNISSGKNLWEVKN